MLLLVVFSCHLIKNHSFESKVNSYYIKAHNKSTRPLAGCIDNTEIKGESPFLIYFLYVMRLNISCDGISLNPDPTEHTLMLCLI